MSEEEQCQRLRVRYDRQKKRVWVCQIIDRQRHEGAGKKDDAKR